MDPLLAEARSLARAATAARDRADTATRVRDLVALADAIEDANAAARQIHALADRVVAPSTVAGLVEHAVQHCNRCAAHATRLGYERGLL